MSKHTPMTTKINVIDYVDVTITTEADPEDSWSRDSTCESHSIQGITIEPKYGGDIECSFGQDNGRIEFIGLYRDLADKCAEAMDKARGQNSVTIWNDQGKKYIESINNDYFGGYEEARVETVQLRKG